MSSVERKKSTSRGQFIPLNCGCLWHRELRRLHPFRCLELAGAKTPQGDCVGCKDSDCAEDAALPSSRSAKRLLLTQLPVFSSRFLPTKTFLVPFLVSVRIRRILFIFLCAAMLHAVSKTQAEKVLVPEYLSLSSSSSESS